MSTFTERKETNFNLHKRAQACIGQSYLTNSKMPECFVKGVYPTHLRRGQGCHVWDYQGKKYIDFITGLGTNLIGYGNETILSNVVADALRNGNLFSLGNEAEIRTAEKLKEIFPWVDAWKFLKTGNEACLASIKIAHAREKNEHPLFLTEGFHGHGNYWDHCFPLDRMCLADADAVIIEPIITDISQERIDWLHELRANCAKYGVILIFDEIVSGFRFPGFSASKYFGIEPDLIVIGKAMANGYSLAAVGGKYDLMNSNYFVSSTYSSSMDALVSCETLVKLLQKDPKFKLDDLWNAGQRFIEKFNTLYPEMIHIEGYPTRGVFKGNEITRALFFQEACHAGMLFGPSFFFNFPLMNESIFVLDNCRDILNRIRNGEVKLEGEMPRAPIAQKIRGNS